MSTDLQSALDNSAIVPFDTITKQPDQIEVLEAVDPATLGKGEYFVEKFNDNPTALANLEAEARAVLPSMFQNMDELTTYGSDALEDLGKSSRQLRELSGDIQLPAESDQAMRKLALELNKSGQYDMAPGTKAALKFAKMLKKLGKGGFGKRQAEAFMANFKADTSTLEELMTQISGDLQRRSIERGVAANAMAKHYRTNLESLDMMKERAAVLQIIRRLAEEERAKLPAAIPNDHPKAAMARQLDMFIRMVNLKIDTYANRWYTGVSLSPTFEAEWEQSVMMSFMLGVAATDGMEKINAIISAYAFSIRLMQDAEALQGQRDLDEMLTKQLFTATRQAVTTVAQQGVSAGGSPETITFMAEQVSGMVLDVSRINQQAASQQQQKLQAMDAGVKLIESAQNTAAGLSQEDVQQARAVAQVGRKVRSIAAGE